MYQPDDKFIAIAKEVVDSGITHPMTPRKLLAHFGTARRKVHVTASIDHCMKELNVRTQPDYKSEHVDGEIQLVKAVSGEYFEEDPIQRLKLLDAANKPIIVVSKSDSLQKAMTIMMSNDFSQLPVMNSPTSREIDGVISWQSIGWKVALGIESDKVQDYMSKEFTVLSYEMPILEAVNAIKEHKFVLVQRKDKRISGLVTITDIADEFFTLAEPFLYLGQIETSVRVLLDGKFSKEELEAVRYGDTDREINSISDLSFNQYIQLMLKDDNWEKLNLPLDKGEFTKKLECIRDIRNEVMHFYPDQLDRASSKLEQEQTLRLIANFFKEILSNRVT